MNLNSNSPLYKAAVAKYQAQKAEALATLTVYLNGSVGIGEHSDIQGSIDKELEAIDKYDARLSMVLKYFERKTEEKSDKEEKKSK